MTTLSCCLFQLSDKWYGLDARRVREIVRLPEITPVEEAPSWWIGVINRRGQTVPIMDLHRRMGRQPLPYRLSDLIVILEDQQQRLFGLVVSSVEAIHELTLEQSPTTPAYTPPHSAMGTGRYCIAAMVTVEDRLVMLLDPDRVAGYFPETATDSADGCQEATTADGLLPDIFEQRRHFMPELPPQQRAILQRRARQLMQTDNLLQQAQQSLSNATVMVQLNREILAIDLRHICGFTQLRTIFTIPCCPQHIAGQINLRGDIVTLVDISSMLGIQLLPDTPYRYALLVRIHEQRIGILVHDLLDILALTEKEIIMSHEQQSSRLDPSWTRNVTWYHEQMVPLLDLERLCQNKLLAADATEQERP
ncbi:MAG: chemotaxis protein CheW [Magnetococcales bacterium]|nr:chemotaxis protein CheW [Magnetococcales bacterium]